MVGLHKAAFASLTLPHAHHHPSTRQLKDRHEGMRASWFATGGRFDIAHTGRTEEEEESFAPNLWTAPEEAGTVLVFVVLRDDRGGVGWRKVEVQVER